MGDTGSIFIARRMHRSQGVSGVYMVHACILLYITASHHECHARLLRRKTLEVEKAERGGCGTAQGLTGYVTPEVFPYAAACASLFHTKLQHHKEKHHDVTAGCAYGVGEHTQSCSAANGG
jgi:hypothetical protein